MLDSDKRGFVDGGICHLSVTFGDGFIVATLLLVDRVTLQRDKDKARVWLFERERNERFEGN